jgi:Cof subfamily protein (haloacid dehalogenase superfamily)
MRSSNEFVMRGVVLDLDGTSLRSDHTVSPEMIALGGELRDRGIWLTLASARPPRSIQMIARSFQSEGPWIALNGAIVFSGEREIVWRRSLPTDVVSAICTLCAGDADISCNIYSGFDWFVGRYDAHIMNEARILGFQPTLLPAGSDRWPDADKILLIVKAEEQDKVCNRLRMISPEMYVVVSKPTYIEITHRDANKASALSIAARAVAVDVGSLLSAGDGENDVPMLTLCGHSIAMAHSPPCVRQAASCVIGSNDDDSLAQTIRSLLPARG